MSVSDSKQVKGRELRHRVLVCLNKLSDRDTHSSAASELESIARTLPADGFSSFISSISVTDASDKSPVRRQCVRLVSVLCESHGNALSPYLSKLLSAIVRRLRDPDSSVRSVCVAASLSLSSHLTNSPFNSITKPFLESLFTEQDIHAQIGAALCLAAIIEGSQKTDVISLRRLLPRFQKLVKCDSFKAKPALLTLIGNVIGVTGVVNTCGDNVSKNLIACMMEFLQSEDWAARKAAAETLTKIAGVEKTSLSEYKSSCLKTLESKRFDKVKAAREAMTLTIEAWKKIPDQPDEVTQPTESPPSPKVEASNDRRPRMPKTSIGSTVLQNKKRSPLDNQTRNTSVSDDFQTSVVRRRASFGVQNKSKPAIFRKFDSKKPLSNWNVEIGVPDGVSPNGESGDISRTKEEGKRIENPEIKPLFNDTGDNVNQDHRECHELSLIRKQLVQIENHQSHLLDLLQKFMGTSQSGMHSLESRVHGLELALDEISFDLAVSTGRISKNKATRTMCCTLPGSDFLTSKLWRKTDDRSSTFRYPTSCGAPSVTIGDTKGPEDRSRRHHGGRGLIMNPLAKISSGSRGISGV